LYPSFPLLYHAHHSLHPEDIPFWLELSAQQGDPILELGCGTGRVLLPLAQAGHRVVGFDRDRDMLQILVRNLPAVQPARVSIFQADVEHFRLDLRFALIIFPCNTLSTLFPAVRAVLLQRAAQHLLPGGIFAASIPNPLLLKRLPRRMESQVEEVFPHPLDGEPVQVSSAWQRFENRFVVDWHYDHLMPDGRVQRVSSRVEHDLASPDVYIQALESAGLELAGEYGDYDRSPFTRTAPFWIFLAKKKQPAA